MVMHQVILSLGANYQAEKNLPEAQKSLGQILFSPHYTDAIWTEPIASKRTDLYLNTDARRKSANRVLYV